MRALVDIPSHQIKELEKIGASKQVSRAELIRRAIAAYIEHNREPTGEAFGLWEHLGVDGLAYQEKIRSEW